jgi:hypothetical protein
MANMLEWLGSREQYLLEGWVMQIVKVQQHQLGLQVVLAL